VDTFELLRTQTIAPYQDGKENPFVLDCSLAKRAYCPLLQECEMVAVEPVGAQTEKILFDAQERLLLITGGQQIEWSVVIVDVLGKKIFESKTDTNQRLNVPTLPTGLFFVVATHGNHRIFGKTAFLFPKDQVVPVFCLLLMQRRTEALFWPFLSKNHFLSNMNLHVA
jgi:hypothetical protein